MKGKKMIKKILSVGVLLFLLMGSIYAQNATTDQKGSGHHWAPSQAAIDACSKKSQGDTCNYTNSKGEGKTGTCANTKDQKLFCKRIRKAS
jgi:uncharacterized protein (UPF0333 family)